MKVVGGMSYGEDIFCRPMKQEVMVAAGCLFAVFVQNHRDTFVA